MPRAPGTGRASTPRVPTGRRPRARPECACSGHVDGVALPGVEAHADRVAHRPRGHEERRPPCRPRRPPRPPARRTVRVLPTSSPTSASAMARRIAAVGRVKVSERNSQGTAPKRSRGVASAAGWPCEDAGTVARARTPPPAGRRGAPRRLRRRRRRHDGLDARGAGRIGDVRTRDGRACDVRRARDRGRVDGGAPRRHDGRSHGGRRRGRRRARRPLREGARRPRRAARDRQRARRGRPHLRDRAGRAGAHGRRGRLAQRPFLDLTAETAPGGERGLLDIAFDPDWPYTHVVYAHLTDRDGNTKVVRLELGDDGATTRSTTLFTAEQPYANHNGGPLLFAPDGRLLLGLGDGGSAFDPERRAQDPPGARSASCSSSTRSGRRRRPRSSRRACATRGASPSRRTTAS